LKLGIEPKDIHFQSRPVKFEKFFEGKAYYNFVHEIICYLRVRTIPEHTYVEILLHVEKKQRELEKEAKEKGIPPPKILRCDSLQIHEYAQKVVIISQS